jgi:hypothetical protein
MVGREVGQIVFLLAGRAPLADEPTVVARQMLHALVADPLRRPVGDAIATGCTISCRMGSGTRLRWSVSSPPTDELVGGAGAVLVIDDTSLPKKATHSVGGAPQYASALGETANCQTVVSLTLARRGTRRFQSERRDRHSGREPECARGALDERLASARLLGRTVGAAGRSEPQCDRSLDRTQGR